MLLGQWEAMVGGLIQTAGSIATSFVQADLAKSMQRRELNAQATQATIEKERQLALMQVQAATIENQIVKNAIATQVRTQAAGTFVERGGIFFLAFAGIVAIVYLMKKG